jgi:predicted transcriptional regulator of viral defense system
MLDKYQKIRASALHLMDIQDLSIILELPLASTRVIAGRMVNKGILERLKRDLYLLADATVDHFQIANRLLMPSYVSFESALNYWGLMTQIPETITSAAQRSKTMQARQQEFLYSHLPDHIFRLGIVRENTYLMANAEKAFLDTLYYASLGKRSISYDELAVDRLNRTTLMSYQRAYSKRTQELVREVMEQ